MINMNGCKLNTMTGKQRVENEKKKFGVDGHAENSSSFSKEWRRYHQTGQLKVNSS